MTRHEALEKINQRLEHLDTEKLEQFLKDLETEKLEIIPGKGGKIGRHKPVPVKSKTLGSEHIIREARDSRENNL
jgi:hypothetical protein